MQIETARLILRPPLHADLDGWAEMCAEEDTMRFIGGACSRDAAWRQLATMAGAWAVLGYGMFSVIDKKSGEWLGRIGPWRPGGPECNWPGTEVGWGVKKSAAGKGIAYEAAVASMDFAVDELGWTDIIHCIDPENTPSIALAQRLGSTKGRGGKLMPAPYDNTYVDLWGQTASQWKARTR